MGQVITDVVLALLSYVGEGDWEERHELQRQGIATAKEAGRYLGRPRVEYPENWAECYGAWKEVNSEANSITISFETIKNQKIHLKNAVVCLPVSFFFVCIYSIPFINIEIYICRIS